MKKEILLKVVIDGESIGSVLQKKGFDSGLGAMFEVNGILQKIVDDEKLKLEQKLKTIGNYNIKESMTKKDDDEIFIV